MNNSKLYFKDKKNLSKMFGVPDFVQLFGESVKSKIMKYSDLMKYNNIIDLLTYKGDYRIILIENSLNVGHWVVLARNNALIFFDPYGLQTDAELKWISKEENLELKQYPNTIRNLMETSKIKKYYSKTKYQKVAKGINTCGRWASIAVLFLAYKQLSLVKMKKILDHIKKETKKPYDVIAVDLTTL
jgi:hypothetical protein